MLVLLNLHNLHMNETSKLKFEKSMMRHNFHDDYLSQCSVSEQHSF